MLRSRLCHDAAHHARPAIHDDHLFLPGLLALGCLARLGEQRVKSWQLLLSPQRFDVPNQPCALVVLADQPVARAGEDDRDFARCPAPETFWVVSEATPDTEEAGPVPF
jgi:hypothetical protein